MKKTLHILLYVVIFITVFAVIGCVLFLWMNSDEWVLRKQVKEINVPIESYVGDIKAVEAESKLLVEQKYENAYLGEIMWQVASKQEFQETTGIVVFTYYSFLGTQKGFLEKLSFEKYAICEVTADLDQRKFTQIKTFGNRQMGGGKLNEWKDFHEISTILTDHERFGALVSASDNMDMTLKIAPWETLVVCNFMSPDEGPVNMHGRIVGDRLQGA